MLKRKKTRRLQYVAWLLLCVLPCGMAWSQNHTISGTVTDRETGETLIGATVVDAVSHKGTITNAHGRFSLTLPQDSVRLRITYVGFAAHEESFSLMSNKELHVSLQPSTLLQEVVVEGERIQSTRSSQVSAVEMPVEHIKAVPVLLGETDVLKVVQLLPGVQGGGEGTAGIYVRGGGPDENLFLLDGVPLYNVNHLGGFFSAFNSDAVKNVTLYKGGFPARFGGRLSSVLDVTTNNGNDKQLHGNVTVGLISGKISLEGPIKKEKTTFSVSLRRTWLDILAQPIIHYALKSDGGSSGIGGYYFYDLNGKITHKFNDRSRLYLSHYMGDDEIYIRERYSKVTGDGYTLKDYFRIHYRWGNMVSSVRWNYELTPRLFMNLTGAYTRYRNNVVQGYETEDEWTSGHTRSSTKEMHYNSGIRDLIARADFDFAPNPEHAIKFGTAAVYHIFSPEVYRYDDRTINDSTNSRTTNKIGESTQHVMELNAYVEDDWSLTDRLRLNMGVHLSGFAVPDKFYPSVQPRLSGRLLLRDDLSLKAGYAYMTQYMHMLSNSSINLPTDLWVPVSATIEPMTAHQVAAGVVYTWHNLVDFSVEGYFKTMNNLLEYKDGASFWNSSINWESKVAVGSGNAYGIEFLAQKSVGRFTGWVGYTWSHTTRLFDREGMMLNDGKRFPAKYDRRHDISIVGVYRISDRCDISGTWVYSSGNTYTLALQEFWPGPSTSSGGITNVSAAGLIDGRNNFRMPSYHRMDFSVNFHKPKKHGVRTWNISVYNLYSHRNPFLIYTDYSDEYYRMLYEHDVRLDEPRRLKLMSIFPIIPSVSYTFKF